MARIPSLITQAVATLFAAAVLVPPVHAVDASLESRFKAFSEAVESVRDQELPRQQTSARTLALFEQDFGAAARAPMSALEAMPVRELQALIAALDEAAFYTHDAQMVERLVRTTGVGQRRGALKAGDLERSYRALVAARMFREAAQWAKQYPDMKVAPLPELRDAVLPQAGTRTELHVSAVANVLERREVAPDMAPHIIAIGYPACHFSTRAVQALRADAQLTAALKGKMRWIAPQNRNFDFALLQKWNRDNPDARLTVAYREAEWTEIPNWHTPTFYFFNGGKLVSTVEGWPEEGSKPEIIAGLKKIGAWPL